MLKLVIESIDGYWYLLKDQDNKFYKVNIEFYDLDTLPQVGDVLYGHSKLLQEMDQHAVSFGKLDGIYGRVVLDENDKDIIGVNIGGNMIYLKRYYG